MSARSAALPPYSSTASSMNMLSTCTSCLVFEAIAFVGLPREPCRVAEELNISCEEVWGEDGLEHAKSLYRKPNACMRVSVGWKSTLGVALRGHPTCAPSTSKEHATLEPLLLFTASSLDHSAQYIHHAQQTWSHLTWARDKSQPLPTHLRVLIVLIVLWHAPAGARRYRPARCSMYIPILCYIYGKGLRQL